MLYRRLAADPKLDFKLVVGGAHLSKTYGYSVRLIREDKIPILASIESLIDADTTSSRLKSASIMLQSAVDAVAQWRPDLIIYAGDREEVWMGATIGAYLEIPTVHFYGGDQINTGHVDNAIRHAASKLSTYHVVPIEEHRSRLMAIGEPASRISVIGSMALDNFVAQKPLTPDQLKERIGLPSAMGDYALVLFHPEPSERETAAEVCRGMLLEIKAAGLGACVGYPNTDPSNKEIIASFEEFKEEKRFYFYKNLQRTEFISLYKGASMIIGNSSSGIVEAASIPIPAITVGTRQRGRHAGANVLIADTDRAAIRAAIKKSRDPAFLRQICGMINPYGDGKSSERAHELLVNTDFEALRLKVEDPLAISGRMQ
jgi:UDP-N-acetylglucosamine 2-epimerase (non-hydrolysing)/GDP/UDP-N,N'-diacetylbacillosamine 2-epimerase (hydrolysing)